MRFPDGQDVFQRELGLVCALDVRGEEYIFELKGTGDLSCLKLVAHYYSDSEEEEDIAEHLAVMRRLHDERRRRARVIRSLPSEQCPNSEVTDELASRRELGLHPILIEVDECQAWFKQFLIILSQGKRIRCQEAPLCARCGGAGVVLKVTRAHQADDELESGG